MKFTKTHEWVEKNGDIGTVGVTHYAQNQLGDVVYVELPILQRTVKAGEEVAVLESTKAAADVYSPVSGIIVEVNHALTSRAELVNSSPENEGWLYKIQLSHPEELNEMMDIATYHSKNSL